ncbi:hypothetical protein CK203_046832 [Vitis vinifera]|uniref:Retrotransposon gag domain-containing protein n=1 Tax=Vitis vinifera TaxID=29760 RepID=A0A438HY79_VITVI|nr:hypothetical protein CK203_046832 [Vitis vinifera]
MDPPQEDQNSQHGQGGNPNSYLSMRDRMHPPRMSAPSCIVPPLEQLIIRPHIVPLLPNFHGMESENPYAHIKEFEEDQWVEETNLKLSAKENEKFYECWERYMEAINACPHHGFDTWLLNPEEAMDFLSYVFEVSRGWDEPNSREMGRIKAPVNPKGGMYMLSEDMDMKAKVATMARSCEGDLGDQANVVGQIRPNNNAPYGNTYNSSWRNHPNFSWKPRPPPYQPQAQTQVPQQTSSVEQAIVNLMNEKGKFPSQPSQNPKGVHEVETQEGESSKLREVKVVNHLEEWEGG